MVKEIDTRPHRGCIRIIQSYSSGGANVHPIQYSGSLVRRAYTLGGISIGSSVFAQSAITPTDRYVGHTDHGMCDMCSNRLHIMRCTGCGPMK